MNIDLCAPTSARGWNLSERASLLKRSEFDCVLALAVIHHLVFRGQIPLRMVVKQIANLGRNAIIEWIEPDDSYAARLIGGRTEGLHQYNRTHFEESIHEHFVINEIIQLPESKRVVYSVTTLGRESASEIST